MYAFRTWIRDGSVNRMLLSAATANLKTHALDDNIRELSQDEIRSLLERGRLLQTKHAVFTARR